MPEVNHNAPSSANKVGFLSKESCRMPTFYPIFCSYKYSPREQMAILNVKKVL